MNSNNSPEVIGTKEAAERLGVSVRTVQLWVEKGTLKAWKTDGGHRRILRSSVEEALLSRGGKIVPKDSPDLRILIVEDDLTVQSYYSALIEILCPEAEVTLVEDGYDALLELGKSRPDLLLVDVNLPQMDGVTLLKKVDASSIVSNVHTAVVTGLNAEQLAEFGELPKHIPVYSKPLGIESLRELIEKISDTEAVTA